MEYRGFKIENDGTFGYKKVKRVGSGTPPAFTSGVFTNERFAQKAIDLYMTGKKGDKDGSETVSSGSKQSSKRSDN